MGNKGGGEKREKDYVGLESKENEECRRDID